MKLRSLLILMFLLFGLTGFAQHTMVIHKKDGTKMRVEMSTIDSITFLFKTIDMSVCPPAVDRDGNVYESVLIGDQCWMAQNLRVTKFPDGTLIPQIHEIDKWVKLRPNGIDDAFCYYNNNQNKEAEEYGALYTWAAAMGDNAVSSDLNPSGVQGVCPKGWHLPSDAEWDQLVQFVGGDFEAGGRLKEYGNEHWFSPNSGGDNSSGFTALPGGYRYYIDGTFNQMGYNGFFWSSTESAGSMAWYRSLSNEQKEVSRYDSDKSYGFSVRCIKDKERAK